MSKITVEIDLEDHFSEEGESETVSELLKDVIKYEVRNAIGIKVRNHIEKEVTKVVNNSLKEILTDTFKVTITNKIEGAIKSLLINREGRDVTVLDWLDQKTRQSLSSHVDDRLSKRILNTVNAKMTELEQQYNANFATEIISKLKEGGFLSEKAEHILLTKEEQK